MSKLHAEREIYEETMKKAFMRGVCALNLEAMHMFREPGDEEGPSESRDRRGDAAGSGESGVITRLKIFKIPRVPSTLNLISKSVAMYF